ncbi:alpha/beta fold hydrolase [Pararhizobium sp. YC-54]|uniref:alpha/beta hydrolase n=1 Tax=Pararhizobium sp. YC-54 TaxID=2986920 RepID=UPI0021F6A4FE|nr:alpha/beta fold hydrolase [Pararhizobium sp. YC-54]MCV9996979.1 alpha/beta fold hydrolase [Pararhizobium sp. YC-54]
MDDIDARLAASESAFPDIRPGLAKEIVWAAPGAKNRTALAIVYIHGFSASKGEVRPLPDLVAKALGANLFYTRLAGHGQSGDAMAKASVADWQEDMREALDVAALIGDRTLIIATSTGAALASWALAQPVLAARVEGAVFLAPNFRIRGRGAFLLTAPLARLSARLILGRRRSFVPLNALHAAYWTTEYPVSALLPVASLVAQVRALPFERIGTPALFIQSPRDQVVDARQTAAVAGRWGGPATLLDPGETGDPYAHVIAGDALSPKTTGRLAVNVIDWFKYIIQRSELKR